MSSWSMARTGDEIFQEYRRIISRTDQTESERVGEGQTYLQGLTRDEFHDFVRSMAKDPAYNDANESSILAMAVFAKSYMKGPGRNDRLLDLFSDATDRSLPAAWRVGIMDRWRHVLKDHPDLSEEEMKSVYGRLKAAFYAEPRDSFMRPFYLQKTKDLLWMCRARILTQAPEFRVALSGCDAKELSQLADKRADKELGRRAIETLELLNDYAAILRQLAEANDDPRLSKCAKEALREMSIPSTRPTTLPRD